MRFFKPCMALFLTFVFTTASLSASSKVTNENTGAVFTDLQVAINAANPGDTLELKGKFIGGFIITKNLNLIGKHHAILDGAGAATVLTISTPGSSLTPISVTLDKLIIQNGLSLIGGGGILCPNAILVVKNSKIKNNKTLGSGGGILIGEEVVWEANLTLINSEIENNEAVSAGGGIANIFAVVEIQNSEISRNLAEGAGGGIFSTFGINTITNTKIDGNASFIIGGGIANTADSYTTLRHVKVKVNSSAVGAGIFNGTGLLPIIGGESNIVIIDSKIDENAAFAVGGGLFNDSGSTATFNDTEVEKNRAQGVGGGVFNSVGGILNIDEESEFEKNVPDNIFNA